MEARAKLLSELRSAHLIIERIADEQIKLSAIESVRTEKEAACEGIKQMGCFPMIFWTVAGGFVGSIFGLLGTVIGVVLGLIISTLIDIPFEKKRKAKAAIFYEKEVKPYQLAEEASAQTLAKLWQSDSIKLAQNLIPQEYATSGVVAQLIKLIENLRADTLKEAINLYEDLLHKRRLEIMQQRQIELAQANLQAQRELIAASNQVAQNQSQQINISQQQQLISNQLRKSARYANIVSTINTVHHWRK